MASSQSPSRWKVYFDEAVDAIVVVDPVTMTVLAANTEALRLTGFSGLPLEGSPLEALFSSEELAQIPFDLEALDRGQVVRRSRHLHRADGKTVLVEMHSKRMPDGNFQTILRDMTEYERALDDLSRSEEKFAKAFKTSPDAVNLTRLSDGLYLEINEGFTLMSGYTNDDVVGRSSLPGDLGIWVRKEDRDAVVRAVRDQGYVRGYEASFRRKDGSLFVGMMSARRIDIGGEDCLLSITRDITENKRAEEVLARAQKLEALGVLAGGIAHDFNNLLTGIFGYVGTAREDLAPGHPARESLDRALGVFDRAKALSHQLLTFAKGGAPIKKHVDIPRLLQETAHFALSGSNVRADIRADDLWPCEADVHQIGQVLDNLLINARHAMPNGGIVVVTAQNVGPETPVPPPLSSGRWVKISVADSGLGIPGPMLSRIFDPFFTTKDQGSGLGLATAYSIITRHNGHLYAESTAGQGSRFTFYLPAASDQPEAAAPPDTRGVSRFGGRILILDDEEFIRDYASRLLCQWGFRVSTGASSQEVVALFRQGLAASDPFGLVLLDLTIPGGEGGLATLEKLRLLDPAVRAVATSGYSDDPIMAEPERYGFVAPLPKPYQEAQLRALLERLPEPRRQ